MDRSLTSAFLSTFGAKVATSALSIAALPVIVRVLGSDGYGNYAFLISTFSLLMILVSSGVTEGVQKFVAEDRELPEWKGDVVGFYLTIALVLAGVGALGVAAVSYFGVIEQYLGPEFRTWFYLLALFVLAAQLRSFSRRTLMGLGLERYSEPLRVANKVVWVGLGLGLALTIEGMGVAAFLLSNVAGATLVAVVGLAIVARQVPIGLAPIRRAIRSRDSDLPVRELLSFNVLNVVLVLLLMSLFHVDVMMVRLLTESAETGQYKAALAIAEYVWFVPIALQTVLLHSTSALWSRDETDRIAALASKVTRYVFLLTALMAIGLFVLADRAVPLYFGEEFTGTVTPLILLLPGTVGFAVARPLYAINQGNGRLRPLIVATGAAAVMNVVLNAVLIPRYGPAGAAVATSAGYASMFFLHVGCARYLGYDPLDDFRPGRLLATMAVAAPAVYVVDAVIGNDLVALAVVPVVGGVVYGAAALALGAVDVAELRDLSDSLPAPIGPRLRKLLPEPE